jgi:hypothetical protein
MDRTSYIAHQEYVAGSVSNLDLLTTEQSLVALDAAVASSDASLIQSSKSMFSKHSAADGTTRA